MVALVLAVSLAALAGCGFQPLYGASGPAGGPGVRQELGQIRIGLIADRSGQVLRNYLLDTITPRGAPGAAEFELQTVLEESRREFALRDNAITTRVNLIIVAQFRLVRLADGQPVFAGRARQVNGFDRLPSDFATLSAEAAAREAALRAMAGDMRTQLALFLASLEAERR